jgi:hypothetical protein
MLTLSQANETEEISEVEDGQPAESFGKGRDEKWANAFTELPDGDEQGPVQRAV